MFIRRGRTYINFGEEKQLRKKKRKKIGNIGLINFVSMYRIIVALLHSVYLFDSNMGVFYEEQKIFNI